MFLNKYLRKKDIIHFIKCKSISSIRYPTDDIGKYLCSHVISKLSQFEYLKMLDFRIIVTHYMLCISHSFCLYICHMKIGVEFNANDISNMTTLRSVKFHFSILVLMQTSKFTCRL